MKRVGIVGGGQLARMLAEAASPLDIQLTILDSSAVAPARHLTTHIKGALSSTEHIRALLTSCDVVSFEIEHIDVNALQQCCDALDKEGVKRASLEPSLATLRSIQNKFCQKTRFQQHEVPLADFADVQNVAEVEKAGERFGYPMMLKCKQMAYDGKGNAVVRDKESIAAAWSKLYSTGTATATNLYVEKWVDFKCELAVMVAKSLSGEIKCFPVVQTIQKDSICHVVIAPAQYSLETLESAKQVAMKAVACFEGAGIFGVELFLLRNGDVILNEIAPRPHNSGHYTIEACYVSQFEQHLRAVTGAPLGDSLMKVGASIMVNVLGRSSMAETESLVEKALGIRGASVHWYGKAECNPGRKMAHVTIVGDSVSEIAARLSPLLLTPDEVATVKAQPIVGIIMGSDSDLKVMKLAAETLEKFGVSFEVSIVSAHRTPERLVEYAKSAESRGIRVIIAGAGGAAHLPGMVAAMTPLPVIGVPIGLKKLDGMDSLLSIVQMPGGVPVATVAIDGSINAGLLAARILGVQSAELRSKMQNYQLELKNTVLTKVNKLDTVGWKDYEAS